MSFTVYDIWYLGKKFMEWSGKKRDVNDSFIEKDEQNTQEKQKVLDFKRPEHKLFLFWEKLGGNYMNKGFKARDSN